MVEVLRDCNKSHFQKMSWTDVRFRAPSCSWRGNGRGLTRRRLTGPRGKWVDAARAKAAHSLAARTLTRTLAVGRGHGVIQSLSFPGRLSGRHAATCDDDVSGRAANERSLGRR